LRSMNILSETCTAICEGQWLDLEFENRARVSEDEYMEMIEKKTGVLYGASACMGATLSGGSEKEVRVWMSLANSPEWVSRSMMMYWI